MPRKSYKPEEIVVKLRQVDVLTSQGRGMAEAIRSIGVSEVTYYRWRQEFGGFKSDQIKRLKEVETDTNHRSSDFMSPRTARALWAPVLVPPLPQQLGPPSKFVPSA
jgi:transposase-like protein